jgi:hypothetical protein
VDARNQADAQALCDLYIDEIRDQGLPEQACEPFVRERISAGPKVQAELVSAEEQGPDLAIATISQAVEGMKPARVAIPMQRVGEQWRIAGVDLYTGY